MDDLISMQAAIEALAEWHDVAITNRLNNLPPAQPVAKDINVPAKDCISRAQAIEAIKEDKIDLTDPNVVAVFKATGDFEKVETQVMTCDRHIKILKGLPSAQPVEDARAMCGECDAWNQYKNYPQTRWIPCSERLPEEEKAYLVTFASGNVGMSSWHKDTFNRGFNRGFDAYLTGVTEDGECEYFGVVAWMKKPEPWKGGPDEH